MEEQSIHVEKSTSLKEKPNTSQLEFGRVFTDHMFVMDYAEPVGWHNPAILPYQPIMVDPSAMIFHYGQSVFEGLKAFRKENGDIQLFRPEKNLERLNKSNDRLVIPPIDEAFALKAIKQLVKLEQDWVPDVD